MTFSNFQYLYFILTDTYVYMIVIDLLMLIHDVIHDVICFC